MLNFFLSQMAISPSYGLDAPPTSQAPQPKAPKLAHVETVCTQSAQYSTILLGVINSLARYPACIVPLPRHPRQLDNNDLKTLPSGTFDAITEMRVL